MKPHPPKPSFPVTTTDSASAPDKEASKPSLTPAELAAIAAALRRSENESPRDLIRQAYKLWQEASEFLESKGKGERRFWERVTGAPITFDELIRDRRIPCRDRRFWNPTPNTYIKSIPNLCEDLSTWFERRKAAARTRARVNELENRKMQILKTKEILPDELQGFIDFQNRIPPATLGDFLAHVVKGKTPADSEKRLRDFFRAQCPEGIDSLEFAGEQLGKLKREGFTAANPAAWNYLGRAYRKWWSNYVAEQNRKNRQGKLKKAADDEKNRA